jgi:hypothetical protein
MVDSGAYTVGLGTWGCVLPRAIDPELAEQLWTLGEKRTGLKVQRLEFEEHGTSGR